MTIQNYTSQVPANRSIGMIEAKLAASGAKKILKEYTTEGKVLSISFIKNIEGIDMPFKLPADVGACEVILRARVRRPRASTLKNIAAQAERTAWKIVYDWVCNQLTIKTSYIHILLNCFEVKGDKPMDRIKGYYSVIQYCPDFSRQEIVNVGVILLVPEKHFIATRTSGNNSRVRKFFGQGSFDNASLKFAKSSILKRLQVEQTRFSKLEEFEKFANSRGNNLVITKPRAIKVDEPEQQVERLFRELVK